MAESKLISLADIQQFWPISSNIDEDKINAGITRAQQADLQDILGSPLYYELIEDFTSDENPVLDGGDSLGGGLIIDGGNSTEQDDEPITIPQAFTTQKYQDLFQGVDYEYRGHTIYFRGLLPLLCTYAFCRIYDISRVNVVRSGVVTKVTEESDPLQDFQARADKRKALEDSARLEKELLQFLTTKKEDYPLFQYRENIELRTAYNFYRV